MDPDGKKRNRFSKIEKIKFYKNNRNLIKKINLLKAKKILDLGCGNGFLLSMLSNKFKKTGVENDLLAIQNAEKYAEIIKLDLNKSFTLKEKYDVVILHHVIEHLINPIKLLKKIYKFYLNKNGHLVIGTPDFDSAMARKYKNKYRLLHDKTHISLFTFESLCRLFNDLGLKIVDVHFPYFETEYFTKSSLLQVLKKNKKISPPFYGNVVNFILKKV